MSSQKYEDMLNLALDTPEGDREQSKTLNVGFDSIINTWEVIVRYNGDIEFLKSNGVSIIYLSGNYAILTVPDNFIRNLNSYKEIIYVEMPKSLYLTVANGIRTSCINNVQVREFSNRGGLFGEGVICALIDSGIDIFNDAFRNNDGSTRILEIWDQNISGNPPEGYTLGTVFTKDDINDALRSGRFRSRDVSGHGTHVAGIMAGNFASNKNNSIGIATRSPIIMVKLNTSINNGFPRTTELMQAINYIYQAAVRYNMPVSINISFGNSYGSHDGTSLIETFIDDISNLWKMCICIGTGNEGAAAGHTKEIFKINDEKSMRFTIGEYESNINIQIWKNYEDVFEFTITAPGRVNSIKIDNVVGSTKTRLGSNKILIYYGEPSPYSPFQEIFIDIIPDNSVNDYITPGIWSIDVAAQRVVNGRIDMWLPDSASLNEDTRFLTPSPETTLTIPSTSNSAISVGGYNSLLMSYADFSGRGFTRVVGRIKPDIVAPAVNITSAATGGGVTEKSGTSMACPFVSGSAALLMEWGIVRENDLYLYGEKVKAYLIKGARPLPGYTQIPDERIGYGALCLRDSIPV